MDRPTPLITVDERGIIVHLVDSEGHGVAVPLNGESLAALAGQCALALEKIKSADTRGGFLWGVARAVVREVLSTKKGTDGPPES
jgi:hypothetical protein